MSLYTDWQGGAGSNDIARTTESSVSFLEGFTDLALSRDREYHVEVRSGCDKGLPFSVHFFRVSEGTAADPVELEVGETWEGTAGLYLGAGGYNYASYYRVLGSPGKFVVGGYRQGDTINGDDDGVFISAYAGQADSPEQAFESTPIASSEESGATSQTIELSAGAGKTLYLKTENQNDVTAFNPLPVGEDYTIRLK